jgi:RND family efflux transporter MFP subunit
VAEVDVAVGDHVNKDDALLKLDQGPLQTAVDQATAQRDAAQGDLALHDRQFGQAQTPDRAAMEQRVRDAEQALSQAQAALNAATVKAPEAGIVVELPATVGTPVNQGAVVAKIVDPSSLELQLSLDEIDIPQVKLNDPVSFTLDAYPGQSIQGILTRISSVAQASTNPATSASPAGATAFPATVTFTPPDHVTPLPGMNANVTIKAAVRQNVLLIPERALRTVGSRTFVTLITPDARQEREIQIGLRSHGQVEVASGLAEGDKILLQGS